MAYTLTAYRRKEGSMKVMAIILSILAGLLLSPFLFIVHQTVAEGSTKWIAPLLILWTLLLFVVVGVLCLITIWIAGRLPSCYLWVTDGLKLKWVRDGVRVIVDDVRRIVVSATIILVFVLGWYAVVWNVIELGRKVLFMPIDVPKELEDRGYTPQFAARQLLKKYQEMMEPDDTTRAIEGRQITRPVAYDNQQSLVIPNTNVPIRSLALHLGILFGISTNSVRGELLAARSGDGYELHLWIDEKAVPKFPEEHSISLKESQNMSPEEKIEQLFEVGARQVAWEIDPVSFAGILSKEGELEIARKLAPRILARYVGIMDEKEKWAEAVGLQGRLLLKGKKYDQAIEKSEEAIELNPSEYPAYLDLGEALARQGVHLALQDDADAAERKLEDSIETYRRVTKYDRTYAPAYYGWGTVLAHRVYVLARRKDCQAADKKRHEAIAKFRTAIDYQPRFVAAYYIWGNVHAMTAECLVTEEDRKVRLNTAIERYEQAIERNPAFAPAHLAWGHALTDMGEDEEAIEKYKEAADIKSEYAPHAYYYWGEALAMQGELCEAIEKYREASKLNPEIDTPDLVAECPKVPEPQRPL